MIVYVNMLVLLCVFVVFVTEDRVVPGISFKDVFSRYSLELVET